jgi:hypothetical protein
VKYERVTTGANGSERRTVTLCVRSESAVFLTGVAVKCDGDAVKPKDADETVHVIDKTAITKRVPLTMNYHYGVLVAPGEQV